MPYVIFAFDTEDFLVPETNEAILILGKILEKYGIKGSFCLVGEKLNFLKKLKRRDIINLLKKHDTGYHSYFHSAHPLRTEYLENMEWEQGVNEIIYQEEKGIKENAETFARYPSAYIQPGGDWSPIIPYAMRKMGIPVYGDPSLLINTPGPVWYCNSLCINYHLGIDHGNINDPFRLRWLIKKFEYLLISKKESGMQNKIHKINRDVIVLHFHPDIIFTSKFYDFNTYMGSVVPVKKWIKPPLRPRSEVRKYIKDFEGIVRYLIKRKNLQFITFRDLFKMYSASENVSLTTSDIITMAQRIMETKDPCREKPAPRSLQLKEFFVSPAELFYAFVKTIEEIKKHGRFPTNPLKIPGILGPTQTEVTVNTKEYSISSRLLLESIFTISKYISTKKSIPGSIKIGNTHVGPGAFFISMADFITKFVNRRKLICSILLPGEMHILSSKGEELENEIDFYSRISSGWKWPPFPPYFIASKTLLLSLLQAWSYKPAMLIDK